MVSMLQVQVAPHDLRQPAAPSQCHPGGQHEPPLQHSPPSRGHGLPKFGKLGLEQHLVVVLLMQMPALGPTEPQQATPLPSHGSVPHILVLPTAVAW